VSRVRGDESGNAGFQTMSVGASPMDETPAGITILVDADACPVKQEIYRVAERHGLRVQVVANSPILVPRDPMIERVTVGSGADAADDWIAAHAGASSIVVTNDVPLASRCLKAGAQVIAANGRPFTDASIGMALAMRNLTADLRESGESGGGPPAFSSRDRSAFLSELDRTIRRLQRRQPDRGPGTA
jgi:uncharacterized protein YaiI (UPF0178 family)